MEMHLPAYNFVFDPTGETADVSDRQWRCDVIKETSELTVYATRGYGLQRVCTLDELRFVVGLMAGLHIARVKGEFERRVLENYNTNLLVPVALQGPHMSSARMMELLSEGKSELLHAAGVMAFLEALPYSPRVRNSTSHAEALERLACPGECIKRSNIVSLKDTDHRLWVSCFDTGLAVLAEAGVNLRSRDEGLVRTVLERLEGTPAILVFDVAKL